MNYQKTSSRLPYKKVKKKNKRSELEMALEIMEQIRLGKLKPLMSDERDKLEQEYQVGKYRPYEIDWERIKQLEKETREEYSEIMKGAHSRRLGTRTNYVKTGKKQQAAEFERLKQELENG